MIWIITKYILKDGYDEKELCKKTTIVFSGNRVI